MRRPLHLTAATVLISAACGAVALILSLLIFYPILVVPLCWIAGESIPPLSWRILAATAYAGAFVGGLGGVLIAVEDRA